MCASPRVCDGHQHQYTNEAFPGLGEKRPGELDIGATCVMREHTLLLRDVEDVAHMRSRQRPPRELFLLPNITRFRFVPKIGCDVIDKRANPVRHLVPARIDGKDIRVGRVVPR